MSSSFIAMKKLLEIPAILFVIIVGDTGPTSLRSAVLGVLAAPVFALASCQ